MFNLLSAEDEYVEINKIFDFLKSLAECSFKLIAIINKFITMLFEVIFLITTPFFYVDKV